MARNQEVKQIAEKLHEYIQREVQKEKGKLTDNGELVTKTQIIKWLQEERMFLEEPTKQTLQDYKENGFELNALEMEGFLRGVTTVYNHIIYALSNGRTDN